MKRILSPAIALMNRLSFAMKFGLISSLFLLPMGAISFYLIRDAYQQYQVTRSELESLDLLSSNLSLRRELETLGDLLQINSLVEQSGKTDGLEARIRDLEQAVIQRVAEMRSASVDEQAVTALNARRDALLQSLRRLREEPSVQSKSAAVERLLGEAQVFLRFVTAQAGLNQDPHAEVRQLTDWVTGMTAQVTSTIAVGRAVGGYSLAQGFLNSAASARLDELLLRLEKLHGEYEVYLQDALAEADARTQLGEKARLSLHSLKQMAALLEEQIILADALDQPWQRHFDAVSQIMQPTYDLNQSAVSVLREQLESRLQDKWRACVLLVLALVLMFALIAYLYGAFYASIRSTLQALGRVMDRVADGDMTAGFQAVSRDELGQLGQLFNATLSRIHDLIEVVGLTVVEVERQAVRVEQVCAQNSQAVHEQRLNIEQVATAMNQMSATAQGVANSAAAAVQSAQSVNDETLRGAAWWKRRLAIFVVWRPKSISRWPSSTSWPPTAPRSAACWT